ncbi:hypothetical protein EN742_19710 [Mesorhizobium sp. M4A.F.Ca.ET.020.02.1.1]|uniref:hypothetical protein n=1 Tax=unclassified Mesorhizobium TaxID=325217 RepID=UPI000FCA3802|nr:MULTISPECIES: hypothetical protein [unclassified Mesorhizobium]RUX46100.1 hypothetical protein EOA33_22200 [Mesorhizobium sp. M4A.F.Ca.ET.050.02.1.1]RVD37632.1 hypothetical protein EN742_19710 [Mesorhizobium sp. M4A.F.Ca.ET.020.02.1.1]RWC13496.1 MAG: hypothetical protein EOS53_24245 [Mesorhizobium sp.]RWD26108.1 MAG: hypothetical protein EOS33_21440 [Mesorhizobium sp.]TIT89701.1 MAG: hypothetical protein E5W59_15795 [Mesorhizobium sp.]
MRLPWFGKSRKADRRTSSNIYHTEIIADVPVPERGEAVRFFSRRLVRPGRLRRFSNRDVRESLLLGFFLVVAATLPLASWVRICAWSSKLRLKRHLRKDFPRYAAAVRAVFGDGVDTEALFKGLLAAVHRRQLLLAAHITGHGWSPEIRLEGLEGLRAALQRGRGAIIWCDQFTAQTVIGKRALHEAGIEAHQVSVNFHGVSDTVFGLRFLNRPLIAVENRFLKGRVIFERGDAYQVTVRMQRMLRENGVVLMTNTTHSGTTFTEVDMGQSGWTQLASTPANFAARGGTALFAMSTFETVPFREYRAVISPELVPAEEPISAATGDMAAKNLELQARYILLKRDRLLEAMKLYPEQMMVWAGAQRFTERSGDTTDADADVSS